MELSRGPPRTIAVLGDFIGASTQEVSSKVNGDLRDIPKNHAVLGNLLELVPKKYPVKLMVISWISPRTAVLGDMYLLD